MCIYFDKNFLKIMHSSVFGKTMEKIRKDRCIRLEITEKIFCVDKIVFKNMVSN